MSKKNVAFIGLGAMGQPMAAHMVKSGYPLTVYDINPAPVKSLVELGARSAANSAEAAGNAEVIITILPADKEALTVITGENGVLEGAREGSTLIDMTSLAPHTSRILADAAAVRKIKFLDAPVSGGNVAAANGTLTIMVGGDQQVVDEQRDILETLGARIFHVGGVGMGETVKMANQILVAVNMVGIIEAFVLATKLGADPQILYEVLKVSAAGSWILENRVPNFILKGDFTQPGFSLDLLRKDVGLAVDSGKMEKVPLNLASLIYQMLTWASAAGQGAKDYSSLVEVLEETVGVKVRA